MITLTLWIAVSVLFCFCETVPETVIEIGGNQYQETKCHCRRDPSVYALCHEARHGPGGSEPVSTVPQHNRFLAFHEGK